MTHSEAFTRVEELLTALQIKDIWGDPCPGIEAVGLVHKVAPMAWAQAEDDLEAGVITPDEYVERLSVLIDRFAHQRQEKRLRTKFKNLRLDEMELS